MSAWSRVRIICLRGAICQDNMSAWSYMSGYYVCVEQSRDNMSAWSRVRIICLRGAICQDNMSAWSYMDSFVNKLNSTLKSNSTYHHHHNHQKCSMLSSIQHDSVFQNTVYMTKDYIIKNYIPCKVQNHITLLCQQSYWLSTSLSNVLAYLAKSEAGNSVPIIYSISIYCEGVLKSKKQYIGSDKGICVV